MEFVGEPNVRQLAFADASRYHCAAGGMSFFAGLRGSPGVRRRDESSW